ncbi:NAD(P)-binding protein [Bradyrhizobium sp.]|uniref:NAD(P)-binding protein n=1 Tax=Bradyrhizobium sp. TaxID=376 RepID=UPI003C712C68
MSRSFDAIVIGSGLGGLTAATLFARAGHGVPVLERNQSFGGAALYLASAFTGDGFTGAIMGGGWAARALD